MKKVLSILVLGLVLVSCGSVANSKLGKTQAPIKNTDWILSGEKVGDSRTPTLRIENDRLSGNAGCNNYFSEVQLDESTGSFSTKSIGATKMACPNMDIEQNFFKMLNEANKYVSDGNTLELYKDNLLLMKFVRK
ncbi:META domain-containing protein [Riemerella columbina]|uniref:META domain-containing protein n=1 Tax=Riemerella columbina TaxID=103810 RepID=UPI00036EC056|nr:META domain-containing protein [Riemerella columbina]